MYFADSFSAVPRKVGNAHNASKAVHKAVRWAEWDKSGISEFLPHSGFATFE
jgi:hypothetical protein